MTGTGGMGGGTGGSPVGGAGGMAAGGFGGASSSGGTVETGGGGTGGPGDLHGVVTCDCELSRQTTGPTPPTMFGLLTLVGLFAARRRQR